MSGDPDEDVRVRNGTEEVLWPAVSQREDNRTLGIGAATRRRHAASLR